MAKSPLIVFLLNQIVRLISRRTSFRFRFGSPFHLLYFNTWSPLKESLNDSVFHAAVLISTKRVPDRLTVAQFFQNGSVKLTRPSQASIPSTWTPCRQLLVKQYRLKPGPQPLFQSTRMGHASIVCCKLYLTDTSYIKKVIWNQNDC